MLQVDTRRAPLCETDRAVLVSVGGFEQTDCLFDSRFYCHTRISFDERIDELRLIYLLVAVGV